MPSGCIVDQFSEFIKREALLNYWQMHPAG